MTEVELPAMYPRRYLSKAGKPILIGLTFNETEEFERLDKIAPLGLNTADRQHRERLLELYLKHQSAYDRMMMSEATLNGASA